MKKRFAFLILMIFGLSVALSSACAQVTPDKALHPEINQRLWAWMNAYFDQMLANHKENTTLTTIYQTDQHFLRDLFCAMEADGFVFPEYDKNTIMRMKYHSPKFAIMAVCYTQIGPYIEWTIEDHYAFSQLMLKTGIYDNPYGFMDALPSDGALPSGMYQDALAHALEEFPQWTDRLPVLDVKIEYQRYTHPDFDSYELWSILWYDAKTEKDYTLCAKYYTTENDLSPIGVWHIFNFE